MKFTVFHINNSEKFQNAMYASFMREESEQIGNPEVSLSEGFNAVANIEAETLDQVYQMSNHIDGNWTENEGVELLADMFKTKEGVVMVRSTSVGDVIYCHEMRKAYQVAGCGFTNIDLVF